MPLNCVSRKTRTNKTFHTFMTLLRVRAIVMVLNATFNNNSVIYMEVSFIGGGNRVPD